MAKTAKSVGPPTRLVGESAKRLRENLFRFLSARTTDSALAEDLAQEAFVRVLRGLPDFKGRASLNTWARRIALNVWRDHLRRRAASPAERAADGDQLSILSVLDSIGPAAPIAAPDVAYERRTTHECLLVAARQLPVSEREIILLHDFGAIPLERAASTVGCSIGAAKVRLHRARRRLAEICRADCESDTASDGSLLCNATSAVTSSKRPEKQRPRASKAGKKGD